MKTHSILSKWQERPSSLSSGTIVYDYGFRIYHPTIGKFLSVDPLTAEYPWYTPYQFAGNTPIQAIDLDGLEPRQATTYKNDLGSVSLTPQAYNDIVNKAYEQTCHDNFIIKNKNGKHDLDVSRLRPVIESTIKEEGYQATVLQFKELYGSHLAALENYDRFFFNVQLQEAEKIKEKNQATYFRKVQKEREFREAQAAIKEGRVSAWIEIGLGAGGALHPYFSLREMHYPWQVLHLVLIL